MPPTPPPTYTIGRGVTVDEGVRTALRLAARHFAKAGIALDIEDDTITTQGIQDRIVLTNDRLLNLSARQLQAFEQGARTLQGALREAGIPFEVSYTSGSDDSYVLQLRSDAVTRSDPLAR